MGLRCAALTVVAIDAILTLTVCRSAVVVGRAGSALGSWSGGATSPVVTVDSTLVLTYGNRTVAVGVAVATCGRWRNRATGSVVAVISILATARACVAV